MNKLETLLNTLIQQGWKPWGIKADFSEYKFGKFRFIKMSGEIVRMCTLRELVSLESGLWQFVCENKLVKQSQKQRVLNPTFGPEGADCDWSIQSNDFQYRLLEAALLPEEELGQFLLDNIKVEGLKSEQSKR